MQRNCPPNLKLSTSKSASLTKKCRHPSSTSTRVQEQSEKTIINTTTIITANSIIKAALSLNTAQNSTWKKLSAATQFPTTPVVFIHEHREQRTKDSTAHRIKQAVHGTLQHAPQRKKGNRKTVPNKLDSVCRRASRVPFSSIPKACSVRSRSCQPSQGSFKNVCRECSSRIRLDARIHHLR